jgi:AcrR family transcriptional regulator
LRRARLRSAGDRRKNGRSREDRERTLAARKKAGRKRLNAGEARERILEAAELLFAAEGYDAVSFRDLTSAAGVSLSAIHYHFGSKEAVLSEIFALRANLLTRRRNDLLAAAHRYQTGPLSLESLLDAFLRPAFEVTHGDRNELFNRLRARVAMETTRVTREIVRRAFDENDLVFVSELKAAMPELTVEDIHWRFHFLVGAMIYTMADSGQLQGLSEERCSPQQTDLALAQLVAGFAALFRAPGLRPVVVKARKVTSLAAKPRRRVGADSPRVNDRSAMLAER